MVRCSMFKWGTKGEYKLNNEQGSSTHNVANERRGTINKIRQDPQYSVQNNVQRNADGNTIVTESPTNSNSNGNNNGEASTAKESDSDTSANEDSRDSDAKTVSEIVQVDPESRQKRKRGVIGTTASGDAERSLSEIHYAKYEKDEECSEQIKKAIMANDFLKNLMDEERLAAVVEAMAPQYFTAGSLFIREGESGSHLYVSVKGQFEVLKGGQVVKTFGAGEAFGELAILYKAKRFASIRCITESQVWTLERRVFQKIMVYSIRQEQEDNIRFLSSVPLLQGIHTIELDKIADFLKREFFSTGTPVVRQGDEGDKFYIIRGGTVMVTRREGDGVERRVGVLRRGEYFGEQALLHEDRRLATVTAQPPGVECLTLERGPFTELLGNLEELRNKRHSVPLPLQLKREPGEYDHIKFEDLHILGTMGVGGFGRVDLVQYKKEPTLTFALKCLKKIDMVQQQQQEHAFNEKNMMLICNHPFIARLYRTYKDSKYLYLLMQPVLGGDIFTILQNHRYFPEHTARFMTACVVEAFHYLHSKGIVYRDLKPENLMLDEHGYVKMVDFGFAKQLEPNSKTWTFAGTPEYVAPEIVLNKGHDRAADCWTLGILIHEFLVGKPPFRANGGDHMKIYTLILRGIDSVEFHHRLSRTSQLIIRKLCRFAPSERLGYLKNGITDIKNHKWFLGFNWEALKEKTLQAPLIQPVSGPTDLSNFETYPREKPPPDETSGWDEDF